MKIKVLRVGPKCLLSKARTKYLIAFTMGRLIVVVGGKLRLRRVKVTWVDFDHLILIF